MSRLLNLALLLALCTAVIAPATVSAALLPPDTDPRSFILDPSDLGGGFRLNPEQSGLRPNDAATSREDIQRYQQWGRIGGFNAQFEREQGAVSSLTQTWGVMQAVSLYHGPDGAQAAFDYSRQRNGQNGELLGTPLIGEASLAFRVRPQGGPGPQGASAPRAEAIIIQFRKGNLVQSVGVSGPQGAPVFDEALAIAQLAASRVPD